MLYLLLLVALYCRGIRRDSTLGLNDDNKTRMCLMWLAICTCWLAVNVLHDTVCVYILSSPPLLLFVVYKHTQSSCSNCCLVFYAQYRHILSNEDEETRLHLVYACRTQHDILMKDLLNEYSSFWNFRVTYHLSQVSCRRP